MSSTQQTTPPDLTHNETFEEHISDDNEAVLEDITLMPPSTDFVNTETAKSGVNTNPFQQKFILFIKKKVSDHDKATMDLIKSDPNHVFTYTRQENGFPHDPREHCVKGVRIMAPHLQFNTPACCPSCSQPSKPKQFTSGDPTKCYGIDDYHFILAYRYECLFCSEGFNALHPKSIEQLPNNNKLPLDFFLLNKCCVDRQLYDQIESLFSNLGKGGIHGHLDKMYKKKYDDEVLRWLAHYRRLGSRETPDAPAEITT